MCLCVCVERQALWGLILFIVRTAGSMYFIFVFFFHFIFLELHLTPTFFVISCLQLISQPAFSELLAQYSQRGYR